MSDTQNKWVPVSERLPDELQEKLVRTSGQLFRLAYVLKGQWHDPDVRDDLDNVTHWMHLPEPPEPLKPADPFNEYWQTYSRAHPGEISPRDIWNAAKDHYAKPKDYQRGFEDSVIAFESMVDRILEGKEDGTGKLETPQLEKLRRVLLERLKPLPDFETWAKGRCADGPFLRVLDRHTIVHENVCRAIWNAAQGKSEA